MASWEKFLRQCIKYQCFDDAIYAIEVLNIKEKEDYSLLLGYLFMQKKEYRRAIYYFLKTSSFSSIVYQALCFRNLKEYERARYALGRIDSFCTEETDALSPLESFYVLEKDLSFVNNLLGSINVEMGCYEKALSSHCAASETNPLLYTSHKAILEDFLPGMQRGEREEENNSNSSRVEKSSFVCADQSFLPTLDKTLKDRVEDPQEDPCSRYIMNALLEDSFLLEKVFLGENAKIELTSKLDTLPLTSVSALGVHIFESGYLQRAFSIFNYIFSRDPFCIDAMHYYSSILWHKRDKKMLGVLSRTVFGVNSFSHVTWAVLGNYFSLRKETDRAITCFERSITLKKDPYVLCLLGHEHFMNSNLKESLKCFVSSIHMKPGNISGISGCGLIYERMGKKDNAEYCYMKAIRYNSQNVLLGYLAVKFLTVEQKTDKAYVLLQKYLGITAPLKELAEQVEKESLMINLSLAQHGEQASGLLESFLLELSCLFAYKRYLKAANTVVKNTVGDSSFFSIRKAQVIDIISSAMEEKNASYS